MFSKILLIIVMAILSHATIAQKYTVTGTAVNEQGEALESVSALLLSARDSVMAGFGISDDQGRFKIDRIVEGQYILRLSYIAYTEEFLEISLTGEERRLDLGEVVFDQASAVLEEVTIKAYQVPVIIKSDTIEYNASAFKTSPNAAVEDLLKKMPGIEVDKDGSIKAQGEQVNKVLVEGKEFFGNDPKVATKNLPANAVDKVQVFDKQSEMAEFTGIDDGMEQKTINLALKEDKKNGIFGNGRAGYGTDDRFDAKFNLNRFNSKTQISAIGMANNINEQGFSVMDYIEFMGGFGSMMSDGGGSLRLESGDLGAPLNFGNSPGIQHTYSGGINLNRDLSKNTELNGSYFYSQIDSDIEQTSLRESLLLNENFFTTQESTQDSRNLGHTLNSKFSNKIDSSQWVTIEGSLNWSNTESAGEAQNRVIDKAREKDVSTTANGTGEGTNYSISGNYNKRFGKRSRIFSARARLSNRDSEGINRLFTTDALRDEVALLSSDTLNQRQVQRNDRQIYDLYASFTEPLGRGRYLTFNYNRSNFDYDFEKLFYDISLSQDRTEVLNDVLSNAYQSTYVYDRFGMDMKWNKRKYSVNIGARWQRSELDGITENNGPPVNMEFINFLPNARFKYDISNAQNLQLTYRTSVREPSLNQLQPVIDNSDPLNVYQGNPNLQPEYQHHVNLNYHSFSSFSDVGFFATMNMVYTKDKITNTQYIDESYVQVTQPVNVENDLILNGYINYTAPIPISGMKLNINQDAIYNSGILFINEVENRTKRWNLSTDFNIENRKKEFWDWRVGVDVRYNLNKYSENNELDRDFVEQNYYTDISREFKKGWFAETSFDFTLYSDESFGSQSSLPIWQFSLSKNFLTGDKGQLKLTVFDVLNRNEGIWRSSDLNYLQERRVNTLSRYFMLSFAYSFSGFGSKKVNAIHIGNSRRAH
jgi:hypothetical protein